MDQILVLLQKIDRHLSHISVKDMDVYEMTQARSNLKTVYDTLAAMNTVQNEPSQEENNA